MTVKQLIAVLKRLDQTLPVYFATGGRGYNDEHVPIDQVSMLPDSAPRPLRAEGTVSDGPRSSTAN